MYEIFLVHCTMEISQIRGISLITDEGGRNPRLSRPDRFVYIHMPERLMETRLIGLCIQLYCDLSLLVQPLPCLLSLTSQFLRSTLLVSRPLAPLFLHLSLKPTGHPAGCCLSLVMLLTHKKSHSPNVNRRNSLISAIC